MANSQNFFLCFVGDQPEDYCLEDDDCSSGEPLEKHFLSIKKCVLLVTSNTRASNLENSDLKKESRDLKKKNDS